MTRLILSRPLQRRYKLGQQLLDILLYSLVLIAIDDFKPERKLSLPEFILSEVCRGHCFDHISSDQVFALFGDLGDALHCAQAAPGFGVQR